MPSAVVTLLQKEASLPDMTEVVHGTRGMHAEVTMMGGSGTSWTVSLGELQPVGGLQRQLRLGGDSIAPNSEWMAARVCWEVHLLTSRQVLLFVIYEEFSSRDVSEARSPDGRSVVEISQFHHGVMMELFGRVTF